MAVSIYDVSEYNGSIGYSKHDVVKSSNVYYYALRDMSAGVSVTNTNYWGGRIDYFGENKPLFLWNPSYSSNANHSPRTKKINFGDGYQQRIKDGINNSLLDLELIFELRNYKENFAINHFLFSREGYESFIWTPPPPYSSQKIFICEEWTHSEIFRQNHTIRARFLERAN